MGNRRRIVIVEDNFLVAEYLWGLCEEIGMPVVGNASEAESALQLIDELKPDYVLMDVRLPGTRDGVDVAMWAYENHPQTRIVFITGSSEPSTINRINCDHPFRVLIKPINPADLREALTA